MAASNVALPDLVIPAGQTVSNILTSPLSLDDAEAITLYSPAALDAATYTLEVCDDPRATAASTWRTLQIGDPAADAAPPAAGKARTYYELACVMAFRIKASVAPVGNLTWKASKSIFL